MKKTIVGLALLLLLTAGGAFAQNTSTANMRVLATVSADCHLDSAADMNFGSLGVPFTINNVDATASAVITYTCTNSGVAPTITLGQGANAAGGSTDAAPLRRMRAGVTANYISYALYQDNAHTTPWNNDAAGSVAGIADGTQRTVTAYGVATHANVPTGNYSDTVVVTITF